MTRIYVRKADALREKMTIPVTPDLLERLRKYAQAIGKTPTATARALIERNLPDERAIS